MEDASEVVRSCTLDRIGLEEGRRLRFNFGGQQAFRSDFLDNVRLVLQAQAALQGGEILLDPLERLTVTAPNVHQHDFVSGQRLGVQLLRERIGADVRLAHGGDGTHPAVENTHALWIGLEKFPYAEVGLVAQLPGGMAVIVRVSPLRAVQEFGQGVGGFASKIVHLLEHVPIGLAEEAARIGVVGVELLSCLGEEMTGGTGTHDSD